MNRIHQKLATLQSKVLVTLIFLIGYLIISFFNDVSTSDSRFQKIDTGYITASFEKIDGAIVSKINEAKKEEERNEWRTRRRNMPAYLQQDSRWGSLPYAGSNLTHAGCGLVAACMAWDYWTGETITPPEFEHRIGDTCTTDGLNDMRKFADYFVQQLPERIQASTIFYSIDETIDETKNGATVWASVSGTLGVRQYGGHIVLLYSPDGQTIEMRDPANETNTRRWDEKELRSTKSWAYFYSLNAL